MRLELTRRSDLALKAVQVLARREDRTKARDLAEAIGSTPGFTTQALAPLVRAGWIGAAPGPTGGYALEAPARRGTVRELVELVEGPVVDGRCVLQGAPCPSPTPCAMHDAWAVARAALLHALDQTPALPAPTP